MANCWSEPPVSTCALANPAPDANSVANVVRGSKRPTRDLHRSPTDLRRTCRQDPATAGWDPAFDDPLHPRDAAALGVGFYPMDQGGSGRNGRPAYGDQCEKPDEAPLMSPFDQ